MLGIDLGTTEAKAGLIGLDGALLGLGRGTYPMDVGPDGRAEQSPADWWVAVTSAVRAALAARPGIEVLGICGVGQGPTLAVVDAEAQPVRPAITWQDRRAGDGGFGLLPRMRWLAANEPDSIDRARWLLTSWDALGLWLSGQAAATIQDHETPLDGHMLEAAGVDANRVPVALQFGARLGSLRAVVAEAFGLPPGLPVIAGVNDGTSSILGAGLHAAGEAVDTGGTSGGLGIYADGPVSLPGVFCAPAPVPGRWVVGGAMAALGASVEWLRAQVLAGTTTMDDLLLEAATVPAGAGGLLFLPYLAGERAPVFDETARGAFVGLTLGHERAHLARAVLEGSAFALRHVATPIAAAGVPIRELRLAGRPTPADTWARIKADVLGVPVAIPSISETSVLGAAILAAAGVGAQSGVEDAVVAMTSVARRIEPVPEARATYDGLFATYAGLYATLEPAMHALSGLSTAG